MYSRYKNYGGDSCQAEPSCHPSEEFVTAGWVGVRISNSQIGARRPETNHGYADYQVSEMVIHYEGKDPRERNFQHQDGHSQKENQKYASPGFIKHRGHIVTPVIQPFVTDSKRLWLHRMQLSAAVQYPQARRRATLTLRGRLETYRLIFHNKL